MYSNSYIHKPRKSSQYVHLTFMYYYATAIQCLLARLIELPYVYLWLLIAAYITWKTNKLKFLRAYNYN